VTKLHLPFVAFLSLGVLLLTGGASAQAKPTLSADTNRPNTSTFPLGEKVEVKFSIKGLNPDEKTKLILDVQNEYGKSIVAPEPVIVSGDNNGNTEYVFHAPANKLGYYEIKAKLSDGTLLSELGTRPAGHISYAIVPDPQTRVDYGDKLSRFGLQGGYSTSALVIPYLGIRWMLSGNNWARMEPDHSGQFVQDRYKADHAGKRYPDKEIYENPMFQGRQWRTYHISTVTSASLPTWALKENTSGTICKKFGELNEEGAKALPPFALAQAKAFAADYKYQSNRYYQVTWEPASSWCYGGTPAGLVKLFEKSYDAVHQGDPDAIVVGPTLHLDPAEVAQLKVLLKAGLGRYIDAISFHPKPPKWPSELDETPAIMRGIFHTAANTMQKPLKFIGTEQGVSSTVAGPLKKAIIDTRTAVIMLGEGADLDIGFYVADFLEGDKKINAGYGYYWNLNPKINFGTDKLGPKPSVPAYAAMTYFLDGTTSEGPLSNVKGSQMGYRFKKTRELIDVVWDYGTSSSYKVPAGSKVCDWMGNCSDTNQSEVVVGGAPTYFVTGRMP